MDPAIQAKIDKTTAVRASAAQDKQFLDDDDNDNESAAALFKLIIIGDTGVGKSCILHKLTAGDFKQEHTVTIGVEFGNYALTLNGDSLIKLQIWDTAGQESFRSITRIFYKGSHAVMVCFDITRKESFEHIRDWQKEIENNAEENVIIYLIGNMADLEDQRQVQKAEAEALVQELGFHKYIETSAFTGMNIDSAFMQLTKHLYVVHEDKLDDYVSIYY